MKKRMALIMFSFIPAGVFSKWSSDPNQNTANGVVPGEQVIPKVAVHPDRAIYVSWFSHEAGNYNVRLQKPNFLGNKVYLFFKSSKGKLILTCHYYNRINKPP
jgi:hypothetical protein